MTKVYTIIDPDPTLQRNLMAFGFECGKGWYPLIKELLDKLQVIADSGHDFEVTQIKSKFGGLRVYVSGAPQEVFDLIDEYEAKSFTICEICGKPGKLRNLNGWYSTLCEHDYNNLTVNNIYSERE